MSLRSPLYADTPGSHRAPVVDRPLAPIPKQIRVVNYAQTCVELEKSAYFYRRTGVRAP